MAKEFSFKFESQKLDKFINTLTKGFQQEAKGKIVRLTVFKLLEFITKNTPVDLGRARAGWLAGTESLGVPNEISGANVSLEAVGQGRGEGSFEQVETPGFVMINIQNRVPYIVFLEFGSSSQASGGIVRLAIRQITFQGTLTLEASKEIAKQIREADRKAA